MDNPSISAKAEGSPVPAHLGWTVLLLAAGFYLWAVSVGWDHSIEDRHPLRQAQTVLSAQAMVGKPFRLDYETPIFGPPWSVPLEFPLYQWLVARTSSALGMGLDQAGRSVSVAFHLLCMPLAWVILSAMGITKGSRLLILALWLLSPFYIFWSRTLMIESTALFFALAYFAAVLRSRQHAPLLWSAVAAGMGCLAAMVKITTFAPFALAGCGLVAWQALGTIRAGRPWLGQVLGLCAISVLPLLSVLWWTAYADAIKSSSVVGRQLMSGALKAWNFGTLEQKLSIDTWLDIFRRTGTLFTNSRWLFWAAALTGFGFALAVGKRSWLILACLFLFLLSPLIFTNLHFVHDYYQYANGVFIIFAVGVALVEVMERRRLRWLGTGAYAFVALAAVAGYFTLSYPMQKQDRRDSWRLAQVVRSHSESADINIYLSPINDGTCAYYSGRRALMIANGHSREAVRELLKSIQGSRIGGIFVMDGNSYSALEVASLAEDLGLGRLAIVDLK